MVVETEPPANFYHFLLDLRPTGLAFTDPKEIPRGAEASTRLLGLYLYAFLGYMLATATV